MPHTSYALFSSTRSHRIQSPAVDADKRGERPNACNLCHLDQTKQWAAGQLTAWYGHPSPDLSKQSKEIAFGMVHGLSGDAAQRAVIAWHLGWEPVKEATQSGWQVPLLAELMRDPYSAVRYIAYESLRKWPDYEEIDFAFDANEKVRESVVQQVLDRWQISSDQRSELDDAVARKVLINEHGDKISDIYQEMINNRDDRPISIVE